MHGRGLSLPRSGGVTRLRIQVRCLKILSHIPAKLQDIMDSRERRAKDLAESKARISEEKSRDLDDVIKAIKAATPDVLNAAMRALVPADSPLCPSLHSISTAAAQGTFISPVVSNPKSVLEEHPVAPPKGMPSRNSTGSASQSRRPFILVALQSTSASPSRHDMLCNELSRFKLEGMVVENRAILICALYMVSKQLHGRLSPQHSKAVCNVILGTTGNDLYQLKDALNVCGGLLDMHQLVFKDLAQTHQFEVLQHIAVQAAMQPRARTPCQMLTDFDDTLQALWVDERVQRGMVYPGATAFLREIQNASYDSNNNNASTSDIRSPHLHAVHSAGIRESDEEQGFVPPAFQGGGAFVRDSIGAIGATFLPDYSKKLPTDSQQHQVVADAGAPPALLASGWWDGFAGGTDLEHYEGDAAIRRVDAVRIDDIDEADTSEEDPLHGLHSSPGYIKRHHRRPQHTPANSAGSRADEVNEADAPAGEQVHGWGRSPEQPRHDYNPFHAHARGGDDLDPIDTPDEGLVQGWHGSPGRVRHASQLRGAPKGDIGPRQAVGDGLCSTSAATNATRDKYTILIIAEYSRTEGERTSGARIQVPSSLVVVTARPADYRGYVKRKVLGRLKDMHLGHVIALMGSVFRSTSTSAIVAKKFENLSHYKCLFPENHFIFLGDSGQGDSAVGALGLQGPHRKLFAAFIHNVNPESQVTGDGGRKADYSQLGVVFFDTYAGAAVAARQRGLIDDSAMKRVAKAAAADAATAQKSLGEAVLKPAFLKCLHRDLAACGVRMDSRT